MCNLLFWLWTFRAIFSTNLFVLTEFLYFTYHFRGKPVTVTDDVFLLHHIHVKIDSLYCWFVLSAPLMCDVFAAGPEDQSVTSVG